MTARIMSEEDKPTPDQRKQLVRVLEDGVDKLLKIMSKEEIQRVLGRGGELQEMMMGSAKELSFIDNRFEKIGSFAVVVPEGYNCETVLTKFGNEHRKKCYYYDPDITDQNFAKVTNKLMPGHKFRVKMLAIKPDCAVSSEDCLRVIAANKGILVGAQGVALAYEQGKFHMSCKGNRFVSFDKRNNLPLLYGDHRVPYVIAHTSGGFGFGLGPFEHYLIGDSVLLCFCDEGQS